MDNPSSRAGLAEKCQCDLSPHPGSHVCLKPLRLTEYLAEMDNPAGRAGLAEKCQCDLPRHPGSLVCRKPCWRRLNNSLSDVEITSCLY
ncbi:hypothetical protein J6590_044611 [Homalodisca vitripennis]|nr:hypothetical protein J6590_044611 [Homalodisca vitripennis]